MRVTIRILIYTLLLGIVALLVVIAALVFRTPSWYRPRTYSDEQLQFFANRMIAELGRFREQAGMGPAGVPVVVEITEEELNGYLQATPKLNGGRGLPDALRDPLIVIRDGTLILAGRYAGTGDRPVSLHVRPVVEGDRIEVEIESIQIGSMPLPQQFVRDQLSELRERLDRALRRQEQRKRDGGKDRMGEMLMQVGVAFFNAIDGEPMNRTFAHKQWGKRPIRLEKFELTSGERDLFVGGKRERREVPLIRLTFVPQGEAIEGGHWDESLERQEEMP